ncbi:MAG: cohesin domain-containing protein [Bacteroidota bacterium]
MKNIKYFLIFTTLLMIFAFGHAQNSVTISTIPGGVPGSSIQVAVNAQLTTVTASIQFSISYDPAVLQFVSLSNFNPNLLAIPDADIDFDSPAPGQIWFNFWDGNFPSTFVMPSFAKLFDINFNCIDYASGTSTLQFSNTPMLIEFMGESDQYYPILTDGGVVTIDPPATSTYSGTGAWNAFANWNNGLPGTITNAIINHGAVTTITTAAKCNGLTIKGDGALTLNSGKSLTNGGDFLIEPRGTFIDNSNGSFIATVMRDMIGNWVHGNTEY